MIAQVGIIKISTSIATFSLHQQLASCPETITPLLGDNLIKCPSSSQIFRVVSTAPFVDFTVKANLELSLLVQDIILPSRLPQDLDSNEFSVQVLEFSNTRLRRFGSIRRLT
jgi:hypothetical protein